MSGRPLCIDLFCGLGGWTAGFLAEGYECIGFDVKRHVYGTHRYPAQLVRQDVRSLHGAQFKDATRIVASSPCQEFSYRAMPWSRAKALGPPYLGMELFAQAARIQREASDAAGRHIPMIQENVCGAQPWVGRARWHYGSFYLWGDVPALMPIALRCPKVPGENWSRFAQTGATAYFNVAAARATKNSGGSWFREGARCGTVRGNDPRADGVKQGGDWFSAGSGGFSRTTGAKSLARKAASARIAMIPLALARHIAQVYHPGGGTPAPYAGAVRA